MSPPRRSASLAALAAVVAGCRRPEPPPSLAGFELAAQGVALVAVGSVEGLREPEALPRLVLSRTEARLDNDAWLRALRRPDRPDLVGLAAPFGPDPRTLAPLSGAMSRAVRDQARAGRAAAAVVVRADRATPPSVFEPALRHAELAGLGELQLRVRAGERELALPLRLPAADEPAPPAPCVRVEIQLAPAGLYVSATPAGDPLTNELAGPGGQCPAVPARAGRPDGDGLAALLRALAAEVPVCATPRVSAVEGSPWGDLVAVLGALRGAPGAGRIGSTPARAHPCQTPLSIADLRRQFDRAAGRPALSP
jgi:hypothetical protein